MGVAPRQQSNFKRRYCFAGGSFLRIYAIGATRADVFPIIRAIGISATQAAKERAPLGAPRNTPSVRQH